MFVSLSAKTRVLSAKIEAKMSTDVSNIYITTGSESSKNSTRSSAAPVSYGSFYCNSDSDGQL